MSLDERAEYEIVKKLVLYQHISVPDRCSLPDGKAKSSLVYKVIEETVQQAGRFPSRIKPGEPYDGGIIERIGSDEYIIHWQAEISLARFATVKKAHYNSLRKAVQMFAKKEWPKDIDGVAIDWSM
jgi:hypothetical protein